MDRHVLRDRLRQGFVPYAFLGSALSLTPICYWVVTVGTRIEYSQNPPSCYGLGGGCEFDPETAGFLSAVIYACFFVLVLVVVALLHLVGGRRLAVARSCLAIAAVAFIWGWIATALWITVLGRIAPFI